MQTISLSPALKEPVIFQIEFLEVCPLEAAPHRPDLARRQVTFFLDEIQSVHDWETFVRRLLDTEKVELFLSGLLLTLDVLPPRHRLPPSVRWQGVIAWLLTER